MKTSVCVIVTLVVGMFNLAAHAQQNAKLGDSHLFGWLDSNHDERLDPYETLDALLQLQIELDEKQLTSSRIEIFLKKRAVEQREEVQEMLGELDENGDGKTTLKELDEETREFARMLDENHDGTISLEEASSFEMDDQFFLNAEEIREEVNGLFGELDKNKDAQLIQVEAIDHVMSWSQISEADIDGNEKVTKPEMIAFLTADNQKAEFKIIDGVAVMKGVINAETPATVLRLIHEHPMVRTIEMANVPGSIDDEANLRAARYVRKFGFTTVIKSDGSVASGGTDFFLAGKKRIVENGGKLGIHSWGGPGFQGKDVPKDDPQHQLYLRYYKEIGIPAGFYWRTLEAAPANDIHWMTEKEIQQFKVRTN